jgi:hypothetical protein
MPPGEDSRQKAAQLTFDDILTKVQGDPASPASRPSPDTMDGAHLAKLLDRNFERLDPNNDGISREEIANALLSPWSFSQEEVTMLKLLEKYFDTIANMVDEEPGKDTRITAADKEVLSQFLVYSGIDLDTLARWRSLDKIE